MTQQPIAAPENAPENTPANTPEETTYCAVHPDRETGLRCITCGRYMCPECAVRTPVGYRCRECVRGLENRFYNTKGSADFAIMGGVAGGLALVAGAIGAALNLPLLFALIIGLPVGGAIAEAAVRAVARRRARQAPQIIAGAVVVGALIGAVVQRILLISGRARGADFGEVLNVAFTLVINDWGTLLLIALLAVGAFGLVRSRS